MTAEPIQTIEEAKAALDDEIATADMMARSYERDLSKVRVQFESYQRTLYTLRDLRKRMDPPEAPALTVVEQAA